MSWLWRIAGLALTGLAVLGALLPVMPSTVFAIGAAACFARSSPRLERWVLAHKTLGPAVVAWRAERAIPAAAKRVALSSMALSALFVAATAPTGVALLSAAILAASGLYVGTRPQPGLQTAPA